MRKFFFNSLSFLFLFTDRIYIQDISMTINHPCSMNTNIQSPRLLLILLEPANEISTWDIHVAVTYLNNLPYGHHEYICMYTYIPIYKYIHIYIHTSIIHISIVSKPQKPSSFFIFSFIISFSLIQFTHIEFG